MYREVRSRETAKHPKTGWSLPGFYNMYLNVFNLWLRIHLIIIIYCPLLDFISYKYVVYRWWQSERAVSVPMLKRKRSPISSILGGIFFLVTSCSLGLMISKNRRFTRLVEVKYTNPLSHLAQELHRAAQDDESSFCPIEHVDSSCVRVVFLSRTYNSGLGHQLLELLFGLHTSISLNAAFKFDGFSERKSAHGTNYMFATRMLGLERFMLNEDYDTDHLYVVPLNNTSDRTCGVVIRGNYKECPGGSCFMSPFTNLLSTRYLRCLRTQASRLGTWKIRNPFANSDTFNIVWHVRVGDIELHPPESGFNANLHKSLSPFLADISNVKFLFVGQWSLCSSERLASYKKSLSSFATDATFFESEIEDTMLYLMHSDILIGSGSSLPLVAALFSDTALYVNVKPKTGWNYFCEFIPDGLITDDNGHILNHVLEIQQKVLEKKLLRESSLKK